jgi:hypothetical protein
MDSKAEIGPTGRLLSKCVERVKNFCLFVNYEWGELDGSNSKNALVVFSNIRYLALL